MKPDQLPATVWVVIHRPGHAFHGWRGTIYQFKTFNRGKNKGEWVVINVDGDTAIQIEARREYVRMED